MKILKLILRNINSLYGTWTIDFTDPAFSGGIFVITGKTGSGKTTLLDGMALALYASTPRIPYSSRSAEVVSRGAADCLAELTFESGGHTYIASFSYSSYKKGPKKGQLNEKYSHTLARDGTVIADLSTQVQQLVQEVTGLDRNRFCRTVMLAQGKFDAFLSAKKDKAPILEQITGTEIYTKIAAGIKDHFDQANDDLERIENDCQGIQLLSGEEENEKILTLRNTKIQLENLITQQKQLDDHRQAFLAAERCRNDLTENSAELQLVMDEIRAFAPEKMRLELARKAEPLRVIKEALDDLKQKNTETIEKLELQEKLIPALENGVRTTETASTAAAAQAEKLLAEQNRLQALLVEVRELDRFIAEHTTSLAAYLKQIAEEKKILAAEQNKISQYRSTLDELNRNFEADKAYCSTHGEDSSLAERAARWRESVKNIASLWQKILQMKKSLVPAAEEHTAAANAVTAAEKKKVSLESAWKTQQDQLEQLRQQIAGCEARSSLEKRKESLLRNMSLIRDILNYEDARKHLQDGSPCPLCGAKEHPFAAGNIPAVDQNEAELAEIGAALQDLDVLEQKIRSAETALQNGENAVHRAGLDLQMKQQLRDGAARRLQELQTAVDSAESEYRNLWNDQDQEFKSAGFQWEGTFPEEIDRRIRAWRDAVARQEDFEQTSQSVNTELSLARSRADDAAKRLQAAETSHTEKTAELEHVTAVRTERFGKRDPDQEQQLMTEAVRKAEQENRTASVAAARAASALEQAHQQCEKFRQEIGQCASAIAESEKHFTEKCRELSIDPAQCPLMDAEDLDRLSAASASLTARETQLRQDALQLTAELENVSASLPEDFDIQSVQEILASLPDQLNSISNSIGALEMELKHNAAEKERLAGKMTELESIRKNADRWGNLYNLIGKGNQFQRIAQGITLDNLLAMANLELKHLCNRYELIRSEKDPLELLIDVVDYDQGGEIRSSDSLSGGERFVVSLSLALGLSRMAGERIRVDSLFIDEGFGTLDEGILQIVMNALGKLRNDGKLVGIISHVSGLEEQISCVLELTSSGEGRSVLSGPGVTRGDD